MTIDMGQNKVCFHGFVLGDGTEVVCNPSRRGVKFFNVIGCNSLKTLVSKK
jgi:hypothetical protein